MLGPNRRPFWLAHPMVTLCFADALPLCVSSDSIIMTQVRWLQPSPKNLIFAIRLIPHDRMPIL